MPQQPGDTAGQGRLALVALLVGAVAIGLAPILVRLADIGPTASAAWRTGLAAPVFFLLASILPGGRSSDKQPTGFPVLAALMMAGMFFAGDLGFWHASLVRTSVANATLFTNAAPILVTLGAFALFGDRITVGFLAGLLVAIVGAVLVIGDSLGRGGSFLSGDLLAMISACFYAAYLLSVSRLRRRVQTLELMAWSSLASALVLTAASLALGERLLPVSAAGWGVLFALAWIAQFAGQGLIAFALAHLPVSFSSVGLLMQPAAAALFAFWLLDEPLSAAQASGGAIILAGIYLARRAG